MTNIELIDLLKQIKADTDLAKNMSSIQNTTEMLELTARLIDYTDVLQDAKDEMEYKAKQLDSKIKTLKEYVRVSKARTQELSINDSLKRKGL